MYVIYQYTDKIYNNIENLTVAPDTHICKATHRLALINNDEFNASNVQQIVIDRWQELLKNINRLIFIQFYGYEVEMVLRRLSNEYFNRLKKSR